MGSSCDDAPYASLRLSDKLGCIQLPHVGYSRSEGLEKHLAEQITRLLAGETRGSGSRDDSGPPERVDLGI